MEWQKYLDSVIEEVLLDEETLQQRVKELGAQITADYADSDGKLVLLGILRGSVTFMCDLMRHVELPFSIDFMMARSYHKGTVSTGNVEIVKDTTDSITGKHVVIVEDIIDSGVTLSHLVRVLSERNPKSIRIVTLLDKPARRKSDLQADYSGFTIPDLFVVGYGLDFAEQYRQLPYVACLKPEAYQA